MKVVLLMAYFVTLLNAEDCCYLDQDIERRRLFIGESCTVCEEGLGGKGDERRRMRYEDCCVDCGPLLDRRRLIFGKCCNVCDSGLLLGRQDMDNEINRNNENHVINDGGFDLKEILMISAGHDHREIERVKQLFAKRLTSEEHLDRVNTKAETSAAACHAAQAESQVAAANIKVHEALLDQTRLLAPFDGIVVEINGEVGEYVTPSPPGVPTPPAVDLVDLTCLFVTACLVSLASPVVASALLRAIFFQVNDLPMVVAR